MIWYLVSIKHEVDKLLCNRFIGNISFQFHIKDGRISNMNITLLKSIREPEEYIDRMSLVEELLKT